MGEAAAPSQEPPKPARRGNIVERKEALEISAYAGVNPSTGKKERLYERLPLDTPDREIQRRLTALVARGDEMARTRRLRRKEGGYVEPELKERPPGQRKVGEVLEAWWEAGAPGRAPNTRQFDRMALDCYLLPNIGELWLWQLRAVVIASDEVSRDLFDLSAFYEQLNKSGRVGRPGKDGKRTGKGGPLSWDYVRRIHGVLRVALGYAHRQWPRDLPENPAVGVNLPAPVERASTTPQPEELALFLPYLIEHHLEVAAFAVLVANGPRPLEISAIRHWEVDLAKHSLELIGEGVVIERIPGQSERWVVRSGTTEKRRKRSIVLDDLACSLLERVIEKKEQAARLAGQTLSGRSFVFSVYPDGSEPISPQAMSARFTKYVIRAIEDEKMQMPRMRLYDMRHFGITSLLRAGRSPAQVAYRFGTSERMIWERYSHAIPSDDASLATTIGAAWRFLLADAHAADGPS